MTSKKTKKKDIIKYIEDYLVRGFNDNLLFSVVFGSYAYNDLTAKDIDLFVATKERISDAQKKYAVREYFKLHDKLALNPDYNFPGEYVTQRDIEDAIKGFGFLYQNGVKITEISSGEDWNEFNNHRHTLSVIGGPNIFVCGDDNKYLKFKYECLKTITTVALLHHRTSSFKLDSLINIIIGTGKHFLGFPDVKTVRNILSQSLSEDIKYWKNEGIVTIKKDKYILKRKTLDLINQNIMEYNLKCDARK